MKPLRWLVILAVIVFLTGLLLRAPARVAVSMFVPDTVRVGGVSGTVWKGRADSVDASGLFLRDLSWTLKPLSVFRGRLAMDLEASPPGGFLSTSVSLASGNRVEFEDLTAALPLSLFAATLRTAGLSGQANLRFAALSVENGVPVAADGSIEIANLTVPILQTGSLGGYRLEFVEADDGIAASIEDTDGVVDLAGSLSLKPDRSYQLLALVESRRDTPDKLKTQINYLPRVGNGNQREVRLEGTL